MARQKQIRSRQRLVAIVGSAAMLLLAPGGAWAGSAHRGDSRNGNHGSHASVASHHGGSHQGHRAHGRDRGHHYGRDKGHHYARGHRYRGNDGRHRGHDNRYGHGDRHHGRYFCEPCGYHFGSRSDFYGHVSVQHGVAYGQVAYVTPNFSFGLRF